VSIVNQMAAREVEAASAQWMPACLLAELEPFWGEAALIGDVQVALFLLPDGVVHAVSNQDPVAGSFVMSRGIVGSRGSRATIASPLNKQVYDLETGDCLSADGPGLAVFPVRVSAGLVEIGTVELGTVEIGVGAA
jgi:nitrite reductase (NADH) small subunit